MIYNPHGRYWVYQHHLEVYGESALPIETYWAIWYFLRVAARQLDSWYEFREMFGWADR